MGSNVEIRSPLASTSFLLNQENTSSLLQGLIDDLNVLWSCIFC